MRKGGVSKLQREREEAAGKLQREGGREGWACDRGRKRESEREGGKHITYMYMYMYIIHVGNIPTCMY